MIKLRKVTPSGSGVAGLARQQLSERVKRALTLVSKLLSHKPYDQFRFDLGGMGFEPGWGNTADRVRETLELLDYFVK